MEQRHQLRCYGLLALIASRCCSGSSVWSSDDHGDAIYAWSEAWRSGSLKTPATVVHFDSHSDLRPPNTLLAIRNYSSQELAWMSDINSFILTAVALGKVDRVIWVQPPWATEKAVGLDAYTLGQVEGAYVTDAPFYRSYQRSRRDVLKADLPLHYQVEVVPFTAEALKGLQLEPGRFVLDIDLDVFATENPTSHKLREDSGKGTEDMQRLVEAACSGGRPQRKYDETLWRMVPELQSVLDTLHEDKRSEKSGDAFLRDLCTTPVHYSTDGQVQDAWGTLFTWLAALRTSDMMPGVVTIAESQDSYLPEEYLDAVQLLPIKVASALGFGEPNRFSSMHELYFYNDLDTEVELLGSVRWGSHARFIAALSKNKLLTLDESDMKELRIDLTTTTFYFRSRNLPRTSWYGQFFPQKGAKEVFRLSGLPPPVLGDLVPVGKDMRLLPLKAELRPLKGEL